MTLRTEIIAASLLLLTTVMPGLHCTEQDFHQNRTKCREGVIFPAWNPPVNEISHIDQAARAIVYLVSLFYLFLGVSIISDKFMASIEVITSKEKKVKVKKPDGSLERVNVPIWNETVSNLTLMALGSSAPEIMLSVIEICGKGFQAGDLGPGTIMGSAAFNQFIIIGFCIQVIPFGEVRRIQNLTVFLVTSVFSMFAYMWLYLIVVYFSSGVITIPEALITLALYPLTVGTAYYFDQRIFQRQHQFVKRRFLRSKIQTFTQDGGNAENNLRPIKTCYEAMPDNQDDCQSVVCTTADDGHSPANPDDYAQFERHRLDYLEVIRAIRRRHPSIDQHQLEEQAQLEVLSRGPKSRAFYRIQATRALTGRRNVLCLGRIEVLGGDSGFKDYRDQMTQEEEANLRVDEQLSYDKKSEQQSGVGGGSERQQQVFFEPGHYTVPESVGQVVLTVTRCGPGIERTWLETDYESADGSATANSDYVPIRGRILFRPGQSRIDLTVRIVDDDEWEEDEHFFVHLGPLLRLTHTRGTQAHQRCTSALANPKSATVMILDDDHPGLFQFEQDRVVVPESGGSVELKVVRSSGFRGNVRLPYKTVAKTAEGDGIDFVDCSGYLDFHNDQTEAKITIPLVNNSEYEKNKSFLVELGVPLITKKNEHSALQFVEEIGRRLSFRSHSGSVDTDAAVAVDSTTEEACSGQPKLGAVRSAEIIIQESKAFKNMVDHLMKKGRLAKMLGYSSWAQQFIEAISINYDEDDEDNTGDEKENITRQAAMTNSKEDDHVTVNCEGKELEPTQVKHAPISTYIMHYLTVFWKIMFAFVPPPDICGGWLCFVVSIGMIGILTAVIGDLASGFGCTVGLPDFITAITFVALGTSLPDTMASKVAAISDSTADNSVGNVNGSNAVNVYLGIGLAWLIAACYHGARGEEFRVDPGNLGFSVTLYCGLAAGALVLLLLRRIPRFGGGELGGPNGPKYFTSAVFFLFWAIYIAMSTLHNYSYI